MEKVGKFGAEFPDDFLCGTEARMTDVGVDLLVISLAPISMHSFSNHKDGSKLRFVFGVSRDVVIRRYVDSPPSFPGTPFPCKTAKIWKKTPMLLLFMTPFPFLQL